MWDVRPGNRYYYRHRRIDNRAVRLYIGTGEAAEQAAAEDDQRRAHRAALREHRRVEQGTWQNTQALLDDLICHSDLIVNVAMTAAGYYRHDHGAWRRRLLYVRSS